MSDTYLFWAIINTAISFFFLTNGVVKHRSIAAAIPSGILAAVFWAMAVTQ